MPKRTPRETYHLRETYRTLRRRGKTVAEAGKLAKRYVEILETRKKYPLLNFVELDKLAKTPHYGFDLVLSQLARAERELTDNRPTIQKEIIMSTCRSIYLGKHAERTKQVAAVIQFSTNLAEDIRKACFPNYSTYSPIKKKNIDQFIQKNAFGFLVHNSMVMILVLAIHKAKKGTEDRRLLEKLKVLFKKQENMRYMAEEVTRQLNESAK